MKFIARVEGYAGTKEYDSIDSFINTLTNFLKEAKEEEVIKFTLFDIKEQEVNKMDEHKIDKEESTKEYMILKALEKSDLDWALAIDIVNMDGVDLSIKRLYHYLNILRKEDSLCYKRDERGKWVYKSKSDKIADDKITDDKIADDKIADDEIIDKELLIKLHDLKYLNDKGNQALINLLLERGN